MQSSQKAKTRLLKLLSYAQTTQGNTTSLGFAALGSWPVLVAFVGLTGLIVANIALAAQKSARQNRDQIEIYFVFIIIFCVLAAFGFVVSILNLQNLITMVQESEGFEGATFAIRDPIQEATKQVSAELKDEDIVDSIEKIQRAIRNGQVTRENGEASIKNLLSKLSPNFQAQVKARLAGIQQPIITQPAVKGTDLLKTGLIKAERTQEEKIKEANKKIAAARNALDAATAEAKAATGDAKKAVTESDAAIATLFSNK